jgi:hypothetical protein
VLDKDKEAALHVSRGDGEVSFTYSESGNSELIGRIDGKRTVQQIEDSLPWALKQSLLHHTRKQSGNTTYENRK